jgi:hypothetical protein
MAGGSVVAILCDDVRAAKAAVLGAMKAVVLVANSAMDIILRNFILFSVLCVESIMVWYDSEDEGGLIDI